MYHPTIQKLDSAAIDLHSFNPELGKFLSIFTGNIQGLLNSSSPFRTNRKFFDAQWCWALGHIGILYQMIRWFKQLAEPVELVLETQGRIANQYFLDALSPYLTIYEKLPSALVEEAKYNAVYFACPDGNYHIHDFMKVAEKVCRGNILSFSNIQAGIIGGMLTSLGVKKPYVAVQARHMEYEPSRNVTLEQVEQALDPYLSNGYSVVSTGLDNHPINQKYPSVKMLPNPHLASFLISASCDQFIGSDSGAWTIPWAYGKPVELLNDKTKAWIYD